MSTAVDTVESEVRELVRRRGLDPVADRVAVRRLVEEVVHEYDERSLTSSLAPLPDAAAAARSVYDAVAGCGPLQHTSTTGRSRMLAVVSPSSTLRTGLSGLVRRPGRRPVGPSSSRPDHVWNAAVQSVRNSVEAGNTGCPYCRGLRVSVTNSVAALLPDAARQWDTERNQTGPEQVVAGSNKKYWWRCEAGPGPSGHAHHALLVDPVAVASGGVWFRRGCHSASS